MDLLGAAHCTRDFVSVQDICNCVQKEIDTISTSLGFDWTYLAAVTALKT